MGTYGVAQICLNGHAITSSYERYPEFRKNFCDKCGASTITECQNCKAKIQGYYYGEGLSLAPYTVPSFCHNCGKPYPWTESKLKAAKELSDEIEGLSENDRDLLKKSLDDIVKDTPQTSVSALRIKRIVAKAGVVTANALRDILVDIVSETAKKLIWPNQ